MEEIGSCSMLIIRCINCSQKLREEPSEMAYEEEWDEESLRKGFCDFCFDEKSHNSSEAKLLRAIFGSQEVK